MAKTPSQTPFSMDGKIVVVGEDFYKVQTCQHIFDPCKFCSLKGSCVFCSGQFDYDCPFESRDMYLQKLKTVTDGMKELAERIRKEQPEAKWFVLVTKETPKDTSICNNTSFKDIADRLVALQARKNESYGNAFGQSCDKYGIVSALTRLNDKMNRLDSLYKSSEQSVFGESFTDTLTDLAAYALMTIEYIENHQKT